MNLKSISKSSFYEFWKYTLNITLEKLLDGKSHTVSSGAYLDRDASVIYIFRNLLSSSKVLVANRDNLDTINRELVNGPIEADDILAIKGFSDYEVAFDDFDFYLEKEPNFKPTLKTNFEIKIVTRKDQEAISIFYKDCSEEEISTLDLEFDDNSSHAWGIYNGNKILGLGRYYIIPNTTGVIDITLLVTKKNRGHGLASVLLDKILQHGIQNNLVPRYRVKTDNFSSIRVAEKFGFKPYSHILAISKK